MTPPFDSLVQDFFCRRLIEQQGVSPRTVEAYRDTFRLLLDYLPRRLGKTVPALGLEDLDAANVLAFLDHLETERGNAPRTRNARLAALRSFVQYAASRDPTAWPLARRVLAIPAKRYARPLLGYLSREEMQAVLNAPDATTWAGRRDQVLLAVMYNTGARRVRSHRSSPRRSARRQCPNVAHPGQGPKRACRPPLEADSRRSGPVVEAAGRPTEWPTLPERPRPADQPIRCRGPSRLGRRQSI